MGDQLKWLLKEGGRHIIRGVIVNLLTSQAVNLAY